MDNAMLIGETLTRLRQDLHLSQREVAQACGVSVSAIGMYESGMRIPRDTIKVKLADFYGKPVQDIFYT